jgi:hypothetical protein
MVDSQTSGSDSVRVNVECQTLATLVLCQCYERVVHFVVFIFSWHVL